MTSPEPVERPSTSRTSTSLDSQRAAAPASFAAWRSSQLKAELPLWQRTMAFFWGLRVKITLVFLVPTLLTIGLFVWFSGFSLREGLDIELGRRLIGVAQAASTQISAELLTSILPGEEKSRTYRNLRRKLLKLKKATGVRRIYIFDNKHQSLLDTENNEIGKEYVKLNFERRELKAVFRGKSRASVLFPDKEGNYYKTGFAPLSDDGGVVAAIAVEGGASYFQTIRATLRSMLFFALLSLILVIVTGVLFTRFLVAPVNRLVKAARDIGAGELSQPVPSLGQDQIGFLAQTMEDMRESIMARDRQMQMMLSGIAHEVRNPLGGMELFSGILLEELEGEPEKQSHLKRIQRELRYLANVVNSFLDFARPAVLDIRKQDWDDFAFELVMLLAGDAQEKRVELAFSPGQVDTPIPFDRERFQQTLINIIQNAIQASEPDTTVSLKASKHEERFCIEVKDEGEGISAEQIAQIFEPFFTTKQKGTGLGLPLARKIIETHGGEIVVESQVGHGTTISIWLPAEAVAIEGMG